MMVSVISQLKVKHLNTGITCLSDPCRRGGEVKSINIEALFYRRLLNRYVFMLTFSVDWLIQMTESLN